jgi:hypothetical protein
MFFITLTMSMMFRLLGSLTKTIAQSLAPASVILLVIMLYTGFAIKVQNMQVWLAWLRWLNPAHYAFESMMVNEFVGRTFDCVMFVPSGTGYEGVGSEQRVCSVAGAEPGADIVSGTAYLKTSYGYINAHKWRNFGIMIVFMIFFMALHLIATELIASERSKGEVLVFTRKAMRQGKTPSKQDVESQAPKESTPISKENGSPASFQSQKSVFHWSNVCYTVKVKDEDRRILDNVDGWVKPGTLTALMVCNNVFII